MEDAARSLAALILFNLMIIRSFVWLVMGVSSDSMKIREYVNVWRELLYLMENAFLLLVDVLHTGQPLTEVTLVSSAT